jgi:hypothetical protein
MSILIYLHIYGKYSDWVYKMSTRTSMVVLFLDTNNMSTSSTCTHVLLEVQRHPTYFISTSCIFKLILSVRYE